MSIRRALGTLSRISTHVLIIAPAAHGTLAFAQALSRTRPCIVTRGPVTAGCTRQNEDILRTAAEITHAYAGEAALTRTIISFPDQLPCVSSNRVLLPFSRSAACVLHARCVDRDASSPARVCALVDIAALGHAAVRAELRDAS